jgi:MrfA Zn-binding domain
MGFTRIQSPADFKETMEDVPTAPISRQSPAWIPAIEVRGEGVFIEFKEDALQKWEVEIGRTDYQRKTAEAHINWRSQRGLDPMIGIPNARMMLIHSFAHALMQQFAIECGYNVASLRERIYSRLPTEEGGPMAGLLIYTAAPDSEGTLGGLVALGEPKTLARHVDQALERIRLCASDPLCAENDPTKVTGTLHWAACHACLFSPETSCEKGNKYLDRALLAPTIKVPGRAYFS